MLPKRGIIMKTLSQIVKEIGIPIATVRYRIKPYNDFITYRTTSRGKKYDEQSEGIIREINKYIIEGKQREEVLKILSLKYQREITQSTQQHKSNDDDDVNDQVKAVGINCSRQEQDKTRDKVLLESMYEFIQKDPKRMKQYVNFLATGYV